VICLLLALLSETRAMSDSERKSLKDEAEDMFFHAYNAYMEVAWPADELMPLSCKGRYRGREAGRGDIDEALGNFSLTLIDSLDTLVVLGRVAEFEDAVLKVIETVRFDTDVVVSVFETNIRIVGGLVSGHVLAEYLRDREGLMTWYSGQLLNMALDIGTRLLPAFNSTTGLPYPRVNLKTGLKGVNSIQLTCTACAGSMILEFAALSRLSGEKIFEEKASRAMDYLWAARHRQSNLVGNVLNVNTGDWVRRESGVGAGIDSYYEYVAKAYVLLGEEKYLERWNTHYSAVMKYLSNGPVMTDVHMHRPHSNSKHFTDALGAFWPGLQVLMGDLKPAIEQHEVLYQVVEKHHFLPEAFTADFQVHWGQHFLRPEFLESTYFLYKATKDPHYLQVGKKVLKALQKHARVTCGYAAVKDVRTMKHEDRLDSFVLSETFKYLYLLFAEDEDLFLDMNQFVFTTEAHLLPVSLARLSNATAVPVEDDFLDFLENDEDVEFARSCPSTRYLFPEHASTQDAAESFRRPLGNIVEDSCPKKRIIKSRRIAAADFQSSNPEHLKLVKEMGINLMSLPDGRVQLLHTYANALSQEDAEEGLLFMQEMIELSTQNQPVDSPPKQVRFSVGGKDTILQGGPAQFGPPLSQGHKVSGKLVVGNDIKACLGSLQNGESMWGNLVLVERGDCMFVEKARVIQSLGGKGGIVLDTTEGTAAATSPLFAMSGDGSEDISIPMVFLFHQEAQILLKALSENPGLEITLEEKPLSHHSDSAAGQVELVDLDEETARLKSSVHAFLEQNMKNEEGDLGEGDDYVSVQTNEKTGEVISQRVRTLRGPDGSSRTFKTIEKLKHGERKIQSSVGEVKIVKLSTADSVPVKIERTEPPKQSINEDEPDVIEEVDDLPGPTQDTTEDDDDDQIFVVKQDNESIEEILETQAGEATSANADTAPPFLGNTLRRLLDPASSTLQNLVNDVMLNQPGVVTTLLNLPFSELLQYFQILFLQSPSLEETYRTLFTAIQECGDRELKSCIEEHKSGRIVAKRNREEEHLALLLQQHGGKVSSMLSILGDEKISKLMTEYLSSVSSGDMKDKMKLFTTFELILQELVESVGRDKD